MADKPRDENMIAALKRERAVYVSRGDTDRVAQVDEQLKHYGHEPEKAAEAEAPAGRTAKPRASTTAEGSAGESGSGSAAAPSKSGR